MVTDCLARTDGWRKSCVPALVRSRHQSLPLLPDLLGVRRTRHPDRHAGRQPVETFGRLDGLVCCVGSTPLGDFSVVNDHDWRQAFEMKVLATIRAIRVARPHLAATGAGRVVAVTGNASRTRLPYLLTSTIMNAGLKALVSSLSRQFSADGIAINAVSPGPVNTRRYEGLVEAVAVHTGLDSPSAWRHIEASIPAGRITEPEEVVRLVAYLVAPSAAPVTGSTYIIDGGQSP